MVPIIILCIIIILFKLFFYIIIIVIIYVITLITNISIHEIVFYLTLSEKYAQICLDFSQLE